MSKEKAWKAYGTRHAKEYPMLLVRNLSLAIKVGVRTAWIVRSKTSPQNPSRIMTVESR
jgi:hypothetical protein